MQQNYTKATWSVTKKTYMINCFSFDDSATCSHIWLKSHALFHCCLSIRMCWSMPFGKLHQQLLVPKQNGQAYGLNVIHPDGYAVALLGNLWWLEWPTSWKAHAKSIKLWQAMELDLVYWWGDTWWCECHCTNKESSNYLLELQRAWPCNIMQGRCMVLCFGSKE